MTDNSILEPLDLYKNKFSNDIKKNAEDLFEDLAKKAKTDIDANRITCKKIEDKSYEARNIESEKNKLYNKKKWMIALEVVLCVVGVVFLLSYSEGKWWSILIGILLIGLAIFLICTVNKKLKDKIYNFNEIIEKINNEINKLKTEAYDQMHTLNSLYNWDMCNNIVNKTTPLIEMDRTFDPAKLMLLHDRYGFPMQSSEDSSTMLVQSGSILGNPFVIIKDLNYFMGTQSYHGSLTIHWTTTRRDSQGNVHTEHHSETLHASVTKPKPYYFTNTKLVYGNDAAPDLTFSRSRQEASDLEGKKLDKYLDKYSKKLDKMVEKDIDPSDGSQFSRLQNTEFEALFNAINRDNEVQFRLLFTPLAQINEVKLLKDDDYFGDDFSFAKNKKINVIRSSHSQSFDYSCNPENFIHFNYDFAKQRFVDYACNYFKYFYFDMAPLLSIPLYQQTKTKEYIYQNNYQYNYTTYKHEEVLNNIDNDKLRPNNCVTDYLIKALETRKDNGCDRLHVLSTGYSGTDRVDYIRVHGGDGHYHNVPVEWVEYNEVEKESDVTISETSASRNEFLNSGVANQNVSYTRGYIALLNKSDDNVLKKVIEKLSQKEE